MSYVPASMCEASQANRGKSVVALFPLVAHGVRDKSGQGLAGLKDGFGGPKAGRQRLIPDNSS